MPILAVNVDHVATLRQARGGVEPDPVTAAALAELAGAKGIIVHLREDRRHVQDRDVELLRRTVRTRLNLEMAATAEMQAMALRLRPHSVCLVPEKRQELTTEGGLECAGREAFLRDFIGPMREAGIAVSLFLDADPRQMEAARAVGADIVEIHTGYYADFADGDGAESARERDRELGRILKGIALGRELGLKVNLGHGLNLANVLAFRHVPGVGEYSIGHSIIARAVLLGLDRAVADMARLVESFAE